MNFIPNIEVGEGDKTFNVTRRDFLKRVAFATGTAAVFGAGALVAKKREEERGKELEPLPAKVVMIDFAPERKTGGIKQKEFPNNRQVIKEVLGDKYRSRFQLLQEFGFGALDKENLEKKVFSKYPELACVYGFMEMFADHGEAVASAARQILAESGFRSEPHIVPIQGMLSDYEFKRDKLDNFGVSVEVDAERVIEALKDYPQQKIVNFSFQMGQVGFVYRERSEEIEPGGMSKYPTVVTVITGGNEGSMSVIVDGKHMPVTREELEEINKGILEEITIVVDHEPFFDIDGAYSRERAKKSLPELFKVCRAFPDKLFMTAAGNYSDDFVTERTSLSDQWPSNLLTVAEWGKMGPVENVKGADIYVNNEDLELGHGSSLSTPVITAIALVLENRGLSLEEIKEKIFSFSEQGTYQSWDPKIGKYTSQQAHIFNHDNFEQYLKETQSSAIATD